MSTNLKYTDETLDSFQCWWRNKWTAERSTWLSVYYSNMQGYALEVSSWEFNLADKTLSNLPDVESTQ